jgi:hypothetical protein
VTPVVVVSALSAAAGHLLLDPASGRTGALVQAFTDLTRPGGGVIRPAGCNRCSDSASRRVG